LKFILKVEIANEKNGQFSILKTFYQQISRFLLFYSNVVIFSLLNQIFPSYYIESKDENFVLRRLF